MKQQQSNQFGDAIKIFLKKKLTKLINDLGQSPDDMNHLFSGFSMKPHAMMFSSMHNNPYNYQSMPFFQNNFPSHQQNLPYQMDELSRIEYMKKFMQNTKTYYPHLANPIMQMYPENPMIPFNNQLNQLSGQIKNIAKSQPQVDEMYGFPGLSSNPLINPPYINPYQPNFMNGFGQFYQQYPPNSIITQKSNNLGKDIQVFQKIYQNVDEKMAISSPSQNKFYQQYPHNLINTLKSNNLGKDIQVLQKIQQNVDQQVAIFSPKQKQLNKVNPQQNKLQKAKVQDSPKSLKNNFIFKTPTNPINDSKNFLYKNTVDTKDPLPLSFPHKITILNQPDQDLRMCICRGYNGYDPSFKCTCCKIQFHLRCLNIALDKFDSLQNIMCPHCKMRKMDPLNKVQRRIQELYLYDIAEKNFTTVINFKSYQSFFRAKNSKYQIEIRCIRSGQHMNNLEMTWPDQCIIKINDQKLVEIPALPIDSKLKKRKDYSIIITQNIFGTQNPPSILEKIRFSIQTKTLTPQQLKQKQIHNNHIFAFGIYFVQKLDTEELYSKIFRGKNVTCPNFLTEIMSDNNKSEVQINQITVKLLDPFSGQMIKMPARGVHCTHAQCFDLKTLYLQCILLIIEFGNVLFASRIQISLCQMRNINRFWKMQRN